MSNEFKRNDRVYVTDPALEMLRTLVPDAKPNHHGRVEDVWEDGTILIFFDDGGSAPYEAHEVRHLD